MAGGGFWRPAGWSGCSRSSAYAILCTTWSDLMYVTFLFFSPLILSISARNGWRRILAASGLVWLLAQFGLRDLVHNMVRSDVCDISLFLAIDSVDICTKWLEEDSGGQRAGLAARAVRPTRSCAQHGPI